MENGENGGSLYDQLPDADLFKVEAILGYLEQIVTYLATRKCPTEYMETQKRHVVVKETEYQLIVG